MQSLCSMMLILAFFSPFFLEMPQEPQVLGISSVYALQQHQGHNLDSLMEGEHLYATSNTPHNPPYKVAYALSNTSTVSNSSEGRGMMFNSNMVASPSSPSLNGLTLKEFQVPLGSRPH